MGLKVLSFIKAFGAGTAAVVTPISHIQRGGRTSSYRHRETLPCGCSTIWWTYSTVSWRVRRVGALGYECRGGGG